MKYFDLNERVRRAWKNNGNSTVALDRLPEVFSSDTGDCPTWKSDTLEVEEEPPTISAAYQLLMYFGTFIGVLLSGSVTQFRSGDFNLVLTVGEIVASAVIALAIIPLVYEKLQLNPEAPLIVQFGLFVQNGVFWHVLIDSIGSIL
jgi:hypothetical protein